MARSKIDNFRSNLVLKHIEEHICIYTSSIIQYDIIHTEVLCFYFVEVDDIHLEILRIVAKDPIVVARGIIVD